MGTKITTTKLLQLKKEHKKITALTAYDFPTASLLDNAGIELILVGDSVGNTVLGYENTLPVNMEDMLHHTKAVSRGVKNALLVADMPFMSYQYDIREAVRNAGRFLQEGMAHAVKLEGGKERIETISSILDAGIPVMGHIGLTPQSLHKMGGYKVQGKTSDKAKKLLEDALALEDAGVFSMVLELVPAEVARIISENLTIPTIGIGSGPACDGQVLVINDLLCFGSTSSKKHTKHYADLNQIISTAVSSYIQEVESMKFPAQENSFEINPVELADLITQLDIKKK